MFKYLLYKFGQFWVNHLPLLIAYRIGVFLSDLQYLFSFRDRRAVKNNLCTILKSKGNLSRPTREVFRNFGRYLVEFFRMAHYVDKNFILENIKIQNIEYVNQVLREGKGGIILSAHIGNWELGGVVLSMLGYPLAALALPHKERPVNDLFNQQRESKGVLVIPANIGVRKCIDFLQQKYLIAWMGDRSFSSNGEIMDFLGKKTLMPRGPAIFACKTGSPIIPAYLIREKNNKFLFDFGKPIYPPVATQSHVQKQDMLSVMQQYKNSIEQKIHQYPMQWLMFREFWVE